MVVTLTLPRTGGGDFHGLDEDHCVGEVGNGQPLNQRGGGALAPGDSSRLSQALIFGA